MKKSRFTEAQIAAVLEEAESGAKVQDICRRHGISYTTFHRWRSKNGSPVLSEATRSKQAEAQNLRLKQPEEENRRLKQLEEENRRLRSAVADLTLSNQTLKQVVEKKW